MIGHITLTYVMFIIIIFISNAIHHCGFEFECVMKKKIIQDCTRHITRVQCALHQLIHRKKKKIPMNEKMKTNHVTSREYVRCSAIL